jgi:rSAM/selenodomain-associated transferase 1
VGLPQARAIGVLTRAPSAGGKSRLFTALGRAADPSLLIALLLDTFDATALANVLRVAAVAPATGCDEVRALLPAGVDVIAQSDGGLGERMRGLMQELFARGARSVVLIGSDLPELTAAVLGDAFARLDADPASLVLGPAEDGGYYLIAATRVPDVFQDIDWGSSRVLAQTEAAARRAGLHTQLLDVGRDVDTLADLVALATDRAPRTTQWARTNGMIASRDSDTSAGVS